MTRENELAVIDQTLKRMTGQLEEMDDLMIEVRMLMAVRGQLLTEITADIKRIEDRMDKTDTKMTDIIEKFTKWEARVGGILFIGSMLWAFAVAFKEQILGLFKG